MSMPPIQVCPGTLAEGFSSYSPSCLRKLFDGKKVSHILPFASAQSGEESVARFIEHRRRISISGVQEKLSLILEKNRLRLTEPGEHGAYLLKPVPRDLKQAAQVPANEHLTMQIARQVYGLNTAENAMIFFADGAPGYITRRFDLKPDGGKRGTEDFAALAGKSRELGGENFKYESSYEEAGLLLQQYVPAWKVEIEKYFSLVVFNFLFSNGDAHLKNFSLIESPNGDYILAPAYDLLNTHLHVADDYFALEKGLFIVEKRARSRVHPSKTDFIEFGKRIGVSDRRIERLLVPFLEKQPVVEELANRSFLDARSRRKYLQDYGTRRNLLSR
jgi:serine/threonine-protein kinase HipA